MLGQSNHDAGPTTDSNFGGKAVVGGTYWKDGVLTATWPNPCGPAPYIMQALVRAGVPNPVLVNRAVLSTSVTYMTDTELPLAVADLVTIGEDDYDLVITWQGEKDSRVEADADDYAANIATFLATARSDFPSATIVGATLLTTDNGSGSFPPGTYPYYATVDAAIRAAAYDGLIDTHDPYELPTVDGTHCTTGQGGGYSTYGARLAVLLRELFG